MAMWRLCLWQSIHGRCPFTTKNNFEPLLTKALLDESSKIKLFFWLIGNHLLTRSHWLPAIVQAYVPSYRRYKKAADGIQNEPFLGSSVTVICCIHLLPLVCGIVTLPIIYIHKKICKAQLEKQKMEKHNRAPLNPGRNVGYQASFTPNVSTSPTRRETIPKYTLSRTHLTAKQVPYSPKYKPRFLFYVNTSEISGGRLCPQKSIFFLK